MNSEGESVSTREQLIAEANELLGSGDDWFERAGEAISWHQVLAELVSALEAESNTTLNPAVVAAALENILDGLVDKSSHPMVRVSNAKLRVKSLLAQVQQYQSAGDDYWPKSRAEAEQILGNIFAEPASPVPAYPEHPFSDPKGN